MNWAFLLWGGVIAAPLFIAIFLIEGFLRPNYDWLTQPVSALSQGPRGWIQQFNFFSSGALLLAAAFGLSNVAAAGLDSSFWGPILIRIYAIALIGAGLCITDSMPLVEGVRPPRTRGGIIHDLFSLVVFVSLFIATFVFARVFARLAMPGWEWYSIITGLCYGAGFLLFARGFGRPGSLHQVAGVLQRITISIGAIWLAFISLYLLML